MSISQIPPPPITLEDLQAFHAKHFPGHGFAAQPSLATHAPSNQTNTATASAPEDQSSHYYYEEEEEHDEDGLGYYPDGVKRTLTDEQIQIFRHSEIHALLRQRELREEAERERQEEEAEEAEEKARRAEGGFDKQHDDGGKEERGAEAVLSGPVSAEAGAAGAGANEKAGSPWHGKSSVGKKRQRDDGDSPMDYDDAGGGQKQQQQQQQHGSSGAAGRSGSSSDPYADPSRRAALFTGRKIISYDD